MKKYALDYEYIFSKNLYERLKSKVYAGVCVKVLEGDILEITIARTKEDLVFQMYIENFSDKVYNGLNSEYLAYDVLEKYKKFVYNRYFIKENGTQ